MVLVVVENNRIVVVVVVEYNRIVVVVVVEYNRMVVAVVVVENNRIVMVKSLSTRGPGRSDTCYLTDCSQTCTHD